MIESAFWRGRRVFLTGHTGFKGAWLALPAARGSAPRSPATRLRRDDATDLFDARRRRRRIDAQRRRHSRPRHACATAMARARPEIVLHMAAQSLVRAVLCRSGRDLCDQRDGHRASARSRAQPVRACRAVVVVTSDKCYENDGWVWGYRENDALGGHDPYSNSKACAELVTDAYRESFFSAAARRAHSPRRAPAT